MKKIIWKLAVVFFICVDSFAQIPSITDTTGLDSFWTGSRHLPYLQSILQAPVLIGNSIPRNITPTGQKICFDKVIRLKSVTGRGGLETCLFLNTKIGLVGYYSVKPGATRFCDLKPEDPDFILNIIGLKGNVYTYSNNKKNGVIEHWVTTGNSNSHLYQFTQSGATALVYRKLERRDYCGGKIKTWCYKYDGRPEKWFLFGKTFPDQLRMEPLKYLGNFAVGFQNTDKGLFIIMEVVTSAFESKVLDIQDVTICFDPTPFKVLEDEITREQREFVAKERERLDEAAARVAGKPCAEYELARINYQRGLLDEMEENIHTTRQQNAYQSDLRTQHKRADLLMNYNGMIQSTIYETKYKICLAERRLSEVNARGGDVTSYQRKLDCLHNQLAEQIRVQAEMLALDRQYANEPSVAFTRKSQLLLRIVSGCD